ncbi:MAG: hypothetical protein FJW36_04865 [Acidobacteria bacterium]|nr:hypothetical protein [Acidobacteriota bacterium]
MKIKDLKIELLTALQPRMEKSGFKLQKSKERFAKRVESGAWWFVLDFTVYENLHVKPAIGLRVDAVENIFHRTSGFESNYQSDTPTLSLSVQSHMGDSSKFEYVLSGLDDVSVVRTQIEADFIGIVLPYLERHSELSEIDRTLNENPEGECVHYAMDYLRSAHGVIVAQLVGRPKYSELVETYRQKLALISNGFYLPKFEALVADLLES